MYKYNRRWNIRCTRASGNAALRILRDLYESFGENNSTEIARKLQETRSERKTGNSRFDIREDEDAKVYSFRNGGQLMEDDRIIYGVTVHASCAEFDRSL